MIAPGREALVADPTYAELAAALDPRTAELVAARSQATFVKDRGWLVRRLLLLADLVALLFALTLVEGLTGESSGINRSDEYLLFLATLPGWVVLAKLYGLYDNDQRRADHTTVDDAISVVHMVTLGVWGFAVLAWATRLAHPTLQKLIFFWLCAIVLVCVARAGARAVARRHISYLQNTVIVGADEVGQLIARKLLRHPEYGINLVGFVDGAPKERGPDLEHLAVLGPPDRFAAIAEAFDIERVIVAVSSEARDDDLELVRMLKDLGVRIDLVPRLFELVGAGVDIHTVEGVPMLGLPPETLSRSSKLLKRTMDVALAGAGLLAVAPLFGLIAAAIKLESRGPIFFRQVRMGQGQRPFRIFKFRTMEADADARKGEVAGLNKHLAPGGDARMFKIVNDPRTTRVGRILRRYSLDELPQLLNVLRGDMSLVGPRPLILEEDRFVHDWARRRLDLRPGITGLWQALGRSEIPFEEMVKLDYLYVTTWSLWSDCRLLLRTVPLVVKGDRRGW